MENNIEKSFPFDAKSVGGQYDRVYLAEDFARYFRSFITSGLFMDENTSLQILANNDMTVTLHPGRMMINGYRYDAEADIVIPISPADGLMNRIDRIAITWDKEDRSIHYTIREGDFAYEPTAPECRRNAEYRDYVVADVYVAANSVSITQSAITDQRLNGEVCGLAAPFMPFDPTLIFNQLQAFYQETVAENAIWTSEEKKKFEDLMETIRGLLAEDAATHLQMLLGDTDISGIGDGTVTGALDSLNDELHTVTSALGGYKFSFLSEEDYKKLEDEGQVDPSTFYATPKQVDTHDQQ